MRSYSCAQDEFLPVDRGGTIDFRSQPCSSHKQKADKPYTYFLSASCLERIQSTSISLCVPFCGGRRQLSTLLHEQPFCNLSKVEQDSGNDPEVREPSYTLHEAVLLDIQDALTLLYPVCKLS